MIPEFKQFILPVLQYLNDGKSHTVKECTEHIQQVFSLKEEDIEQLLPSGTVGVVRNRTQWALTYLKKAGLAHSEKRGLFQITKSGEELLKNPPNPITPKYLAEHYPSFKDFATSNPTPISQPTTTIDLTPVDELDIAFKKINSQLADDLLNQILQMSPKAFELLVVKLLEAMGYGDGTITAYTNDDGIDGVINEDKLGLDKIFLQAKRWKTDETVGAPEVQKFIGAIISHGGTKGVFVTTSKFSKKAYELSTASIKFILIDGQRLANLMIQYDLGVSTSFVYAVKKVDTDFFSDDEFAR